MGAVAFIWLIPLVLLIFAAICVNIFATVCIDEFGLFEDVLVQHTDWGKAPSSVFIGMVVVLFLILCFLTMMRYGYSKAKKIYLPKHVVEDSSEKSTVIYRTPEDRTRIYSFLFIPVLWYLLCTAVMNVLGVPPYKDLLGILIHTFVAFCPYGVFAWECFSLDAFFTDDSHIVLFINLLYYSFMILSFAAGERLYVRRMNEIRKPFIFSKRKLIIFCTVFISVYSLSEFALYQHRKNIIPTAHKAYGFAYEDGYSSTNLWPYYVENEINILAKLDEKSTFLIYNPLDMPILDGAEAAYPIYSAFANACFDDIANIQAAAKSNAGDKSKIMPIRFSNSIYAYEKLLEGKVDIFFGAKPSAEQIQMADQQGKELVLTPIGKEAFVFFVNDANPVDELTTDQIKSIYAGKITNWHGVGGERKKILAYQRPSNSGSQTMMEHFMGDIPLKAPLEAEYYSSMSGVLRDVAAYNNETSAIGYSFRYYATMMALESGEENDTESDENSGGIKFLAVDGVYPDEETIRSGEYPLTTQLYAITVIDKNSSIKTYSKDTIEPFLEWMTGPQGQQIVSDTGYVSLE